MGSKGNIEYCNVWIATPVDGGISGAYVSSMVNLALFMVKKNIKMSYHQMQNDSLITRARNTMVAQFLQDTQATHLLFLDSDIGFAPEVVEKLLLSGHDVCGAPYPMKSTNFDRAHKHAEKILEKTGALPTVTEMEQASTRYILNLITEDGIEEVVHEDGTKTKKPKQASRRLTDGFVEVSEIGTGFMLIKRVALMRMIRHYPNDHYVTDIPSLRDTDEKLTAVQLKTFWTFFDTLVHPVSRRYLSEDYAFCQKYRDTGGKIFLFLDATVCHTGPYTFSGNLLRTLQLEGSIEPSKPAVPAVPVVSAVPADEVSAVAPPAADPPTTVV